jgi:hypothetical protein
MMSMVGNGGFSDLGTTDDCFSEALTSPASCSAGAPHFVQNLASPKGEPHFVQKRLGRAGRAARFRRIPHFVQNAADSLTDVPQRSQVISIAYLHCGLSLLSDGAAPRRQKKVGVSSHFLTIASS